MCSLPKYFIPKLVYRALSILTISISASGILFFGTMLNAQEAEKHVPSSQQKGWTAPTGSDNVADIQRGAKLWKKCSSCHTYKLNQPHSVGPNLYNIFDRTAGTAPNYLYSPAMQQSNLIWTDKNIDAYLAATQDFMPGSKMYGGLAIARDRLDLLTWLRSVANTE